MRRRLSEAAIPAAAALALVLWVVLLPAPSPYYGPSVYAAINTATPITSLSVLTTLPGNARWYVIIPTGGGWSNRAVSATTALGGYLTTAPAGGGITTVDWSAALTTWPSATVSTTGHAHSSYIGTVDWSAALTTWPAASYQPYLGTGSAAQFLRGDWTWQTLGTGGGGGGDMFNADNLSGLTSFGRARLNLGLGAAATLGLGTGASTVAAGDHGHLGYLGTVDWSAALTTWPSASYVTTSALAARQYVSTTDLASRGYLSTVDWSAALTTWPAASYQPLLGTASAAHYLRGDWTWGTIAAGSADWANPGPIGSGTPSTGRFTDLTVTSSFTAPAFASSGADGTHYLSVYNVGTYAGVATTGAWHDSAFTGPQRYSGSAWQVFYGPWGTHAHGGSEITTGLIATSRLPGWPYLTTYTDTVGTGAFDPTARYTWSTTQTFGGLTTGTPTQFVNPLPAAFADGHWSGPAVLGNVDANVGTGAILYRTAAGLWSPYSCAVNTTTLPSGMAFNAITTAAPGLVLLDGALARRSVLALGTSSTLYYAGTTAGSIAPAVPGTAGHSIATVLLRLAEDTFQLFFGRAWGQK